MSTYTLASRIGLCVALAGCGPRAGHDAAAIAVYAHLMAGRIPALQGETVGVYCLGRGTLAERRPVDARAAVLDTVRALGFHAVPLSECDFSSHAPHVSVREAATGRPGVVVTVADMDRAGRDSAEVEAAYHEGPLSGAGWTCALRRRDRRWSVRSCTMTWIS